MSRSTYKRWTKEEIKYVTENYGKILVKDIAESLDRTQPSVQRKITGLGLAMSDDEYQKMTGKTRWTEEEEQALREHYGRGNVKYLSELLGRNEDQIRKKASLIGITKDYHKWTEEEENYVINSWGMRSTKIMAKKLNLTEDAVKLKAHALNLRQQHTAYGEYYTVADLSELLGVGKKTVYYWVETDKISYSKLKVGRSQRIRFSVENIMEFMEKHPKRYDTRKIDWSIIKTFFYKTRTKDGDVVVYDILPEWLEAKIAEDNSKATKEIRNWTTKEELRLQDLIERGHSIAEISKKLRRTEDSIRGKLRLLNNR